MLFMFHICSFFTLAHSFPSFSVLPLAQRDSFSSLFHTLTQWPIQNKSSIYQDDDHWTCLAVFFFNESVGLCNDKQHWCELFIALCYPPWYHPNGSVLIEKWALTVLLSESSLSDKPESQLNSGNEASLLLLVLLVVTTHRGNFFQWLDLWHESLSCNLPCFISIA